MPAASTTDLVCSTQVRTAKQDEDALIQITAHLLARVLVKGTTVEALALIPRGFSWPSWATLMAIDVARSMLSYSCFALFEVHQGCHGERELV